MHFDLKRAGIGTAAAVAGVLVAAALGAASWVSSSTADTPPVYTATTPSVYTSTTPTVDTSTTPTADTSTTPTTDTASTPSVYTSTTLTPFQAAQTAFYRATIIRPIAPAAPISLLPASGWGISVPVDCEAACVFIGTVIAQNIGTWYLDQAADAKATRVTIGSVTRTGNGAISAKITIARAYRRALLRVRRSVRVTVVEKVTDRRYGFVKSAQRSLVLRPR